MIFKMVSESHSSPCRFHVPKTSRYKRWLVCTSVALFDIFHGSTPAFSAWPLALRRLANKVEGRSGSDDTGAEEQPCVVVANGTCAQPKQGYIVDILVHMHDTIPQSYWSYITTPSTTD